MEEITSKESTKLEEANNREHVLLDVTINPAKRVRQQGDASSAAASKNFKFWDEVNHFVSLIPKVPAFVRDKYNSDDYDPLVVSIGPYHHGHPRLQFVEELKPKIWNSFIYRSRLDEQLLLNEALKVIDDLRSSYAKGSTEMYENNVFAKIMLQDAAFVVEYIIEYSMVQLDPESLGYTRDDILETHLGRGVVEHVTRDLYVLENQIPFWFLKITLHMRYGKDQGDELLKDFLNWSSFRNIEVVDHRPEPGNLVEAVRMVVIAGWSPPVLKIDKETAKVRAQLWAHADKETAKVRAQLRAHAKVIKATTLFRVSELIEFDRSTLISKMIHSYHSVTELKAKGIRIKRSETNSLLDVSFHSGLFFSTLQLPAVLATARTKSVYSNIIAYEMCPTSFREECIVTAYVFLMKSLIESPKDVKELQDKGVIKNMLGSDEEVVKLYKDIYTYGIDCSTIYTGVIEKVIKKIQQHYNSKARTWLADLLYSYFHSPWTVSALLGSILVILLTITQTYYAVHPKGNN